MKALTCSSLTFPLLTADLWRWGRGQRISGRGCHPPAGPEPQQRYCFTPWTLPPQPRSPCFPFPIHIICTSTIVSICRKPRNHKCRDHTAQLSKTVSTHLTRVSHCIHFPQELELPSPSQLRAMPMQIPHCLCPPLCWWTPRLVPELIAVMWWMLGCQHPCGKLTQGHLCQHPAAPLGHMDFSFLRSLPTSFPGDWIH